MVRLTFAILLLCNFCHAQLFETKINLDHIRIDQAGPGDRMLEPVILAKEKVELRFPERAVKIEPNVFDSLCTYIQKRYKEKPANLFRNMVINEFGICKVTLRIEGKTQIFFTRNRIMAVAFLTGFKGVLKDLRAPDESIRKTELMLQKIAD